MPKTGSTSIQATWFENRDMISKKFGVQYFSDMDGNNHLGNHGHICTLFTDAASEGHIRFKSLTPKQIELQRAKLRKKFEAEIVNSAPKPFVLSAEAFSGLSVNDVEEFKALLSTHFDEFQVVVYVRHPFQFLHSAAQQIIKGGLSFDSITDLSPASPITPRYRFRIEKYQKIFGRANVLIRKFDPSKFHKNDAVHDFAKTLFPDLNIMENITPVKVNSSLNHNSVLLLEAVNRKYPLIKGQQNPKRAKSLIKAFKNTGANQRKFEFTHVDMKAYVEHISDDVQWLSKITKGAITFDISNPPKAKKETSDKIDLELSAEIINDLAVKEYNTANLKNFYMMMYAYSTSGKLNIKGIRNILKRCEVEKDLMTMSQILSGSSQHVEALQFAKKVVRLFPKNEAMRNKVKRLNKKLKKAPVTSAPPK